MIPSEIVAPLHARLSTFHSFTRASTSANATELRSHAASVGRDGRAAGGQTAAVESPSTIACTAPSGGPGATATGATGVLSEQPFEAPDLAQIDPGAVNAVTMMNPRFTASTKSRPPAITITVLLP